MIIGIFTFQNLSQTTQISTFLKSNTDFNASQKLINALFNWKNYIPWIKDVKVTLKGKLLLDILMGVE
jgi:hypothetical protein